jgi:hypothetical protein
MQGGVCCGVSRLPRTASRGCLPHPLCACTLYRCVLCVCPLSLRFVRVRACACVCVRVWVNMHAGARPPAHPPSQKQVEVLKTATVVARLKLVRSFVGLVAHQQSSQATIKALRSDKDAQSVVIQQLQAQVRRRLWVSACTRACTFCVSPPWAKPHTQPQWAACVRRSAGHAPFCCSVCAWTVSPQHMCVGIASEPARPPPFQIQDIVSKQPRVFARLGELEALRTHIAESLTQYRRTTVVDHRVQTSELIAQLAELEEQGHELEVLKVEKANAVRDAAASAFPLWGCCACQLLL